jgi:flagellar hook protein FlgE
MGILDSLNVGITGLSAVGSGMKIIGDNIANAQTIGFKSSRGEFQDILATSLKGIQGGDQIGSGVRLSHVTPIFTQGNIQRTESITDLAINGNGFFALDTPKGQTFTRDGTFRFNKDGYLINADGHKVKGFAASMDGKITNKITPVRIGNVTIPAKGTENVNVFMNVDSRAKVQEFDPENPDATSAYNTSVTVYDNIGTARLVTAYFNKTEENNWEYHVMANGNDTELKDPDVMVEMANGKLVFNDKGVLQEEQPGLNSFKFNSGAGEQQVAFDFGKSISEGGNGFAAMTQFGSRSTVQRHTQNGSSAASLTSLSFSDEGILTAIYNNGETRDIGQVGITKFENNEGLNKVGKNMFQETRKSGQGAFGKPGESGRGEVFAKSIELSNVDLAQEFVSMMTSQRNFEANTKTITTADEMLQNVLNIKR